MYIISRCLLGYDCKYDGGDNKNEDIVEFAKNHDYVTVCPEVAAGLSVPRVPAEILIDDEGYWKVVNKEGKNLTAAFEYGAKLSVASVTVEAGNRIPHKGIIEGAILKANSPSCGAGTIYDGTFSHKKIGGNGVFTDALVEAVMSERNNEYLDDENRVFADTFKICTEENFKKTFGDK